MLRSASISLTAPQPDSTAGRRGGSSADALAMSTGAPPARFISPDAREVLRTAIHRPLVSVWGAALLLNCSEEPIERYIESGRLEFAFDIARKSNAPKRHLRILTADVFNVRAGLKAAPRTLNAVIDSILPVTLDTLPLQRVAFLWHTSDWHIVHLLRAGLLKIKGEEGRQMRFIRAALADFLMARRVI